jgi:hypothetical protein
LAKRNESLADEAPAMPQEQPRTAAAANSRVIYLGPNLPGGVLLKGKVFIGGIPDHLRPVVESCPAIRRLTVPLSSMIKTSERIGRRGTPEHRDYYEAAAQFAALGKKKEGSEI